MNLYQRYRPQKLDEIFGNENTVASLKSLLSKNFPTAIIIYGPTGCGKTTIARIIKRELGCRDTDFIELNVANTRGIDTIREVIQDTNYSTFSGGVRLYLFDECHKLTNDAQNALLKTLEDTPQKTYFVLCTTEPERVIPTVRNRCSAFKVSLLPSFIILKLLEKVCKEEHKTVDKNVLKEISRVSNGSPRQALILLEKEFDVDPGKALQELGSLTIGEAKVIEVIKLLLKPKSNNKWSEMSELVKNLEDSEPEQVRVAILNYFSKILLGEEKSESTIYISRISLMMEFFTQPFIYGGRGILVLSLFKACEV